ncbi:MAG: NifU family protein [Lutibacter sp.]
MNPFHFNIEQTNTPSIIKLVTNKILTSGSYQFNSVEDAGNAPLVQQLLQLPFLHRVYISANFIALEKYDTVNWEDVQNELKIEIENYLNKNLPLIVTEKKQNQFPLEVYAEVTPNPDVLKFVTNKKLVPHNFEFKSKEEAQNNGIADSLFEFPFVKEVFLSENYIALTKSAHVEWNDVMVALRSFIKEYIDQGKPLFLENHINSEKTINTTETKHYGEIEQQIIAILNEHIKPAVAADGGNIQFDSYQKDTKTVNVILQGACSGCPSSTITLKNGIEAMLKQLIPGKINEVVALNF